MKLLVFLVFSAFWLLVYPLLSLSDSFLYIILFLPIKKKKKNLGGSRLNQA